MTQNSILSLNVTTTITKTKKNHNCVLFHCLGPEAPEDWKGSLDISYRLGPGYVDNEITVTVDVNNYYEVRSIFNVIGTMNGNVEPDRYVLIGNHRDAWVNGAVDASSGTTVTDEIARGLGELKKAGWKPRRTIMVSMKRSNFRITAALCSGV